MQQKQKPFLSYGIISAIVTILFLVLLYMGGVEWFVSPVAYFGWAIPIVFAVIAALAQKKLNGGYLNFSDALKGIFLVFVLNALGSTLFSYIMFNFVDVPFREALSQKTAEMMEEMMRKFGASDDDIDKAVEDSFKGNPYSAGKMALGFAFTCIIWFIIALIVAAIVKRRKPEFPEAS